MRLPKGDFTLNYSAMPEYAFIRELHVYSHVNCTDELENDRKSTAQARAMLLQHAEAICYQKGYYAIAIILKCGCSKLLCSKA